MDDLQLYIYIALAVIYFIARALKPKKPSRPPMKQSDRDYEQEETDIPNKDRPMTFEELLQEFTGEKPVSSTKPEVREVEEEYDERVPDDEIRSYDEYDDYKTSEYASYEQQYSDAKELKTLDEQVSLEEPVKKAFDHYEIREESQGQAGKFRNLLISQEGLKDAIVIKEILEPKYF